MATPSPVRGAAAASWINRQMSNEQVALQCQGLVGELIVYGCFPQGSRGELEYHNGKLLSETSIGVGPDIHVPLTQVNREEKVYDIPSEGWNYVFVVSAQDWTVAKAEEALEYRRSVQQLPSANAARLFVSLNSDAFRKNEPRMPALVNDVPIRFSPLDSASALGTQEGLSMWKGYCVHRANPREAFALLFLGASGAGKTTSMRHLCRHYFEEDARKRMPAQQIPVTFFAQKADLLHKARGLMSGKDVVQPHHIASVIVACLQRDLKVEHLGSQPWELYVAVDELAAMPDEGLSCFDTWKTIAAEVLAPRRWMGPTPAPVDIRFAMGGTGIDGRTKLTSGVEGLRRAYVMPWQQRPIVSLVASAPLCESYEEARELCDQYPIIVQAGSNPRLLSFLLKRLVKRPLTPEYVFHEVGQSAQDYFGVNGLRDLQDALPGVAACVLRCLMMQPLSWSSSDLAAMCPTDASARANLSTVTTDPHIDTVARHVATNVGLVTCCIERFANGEVDNTASIVHTVPLGLLPFEASPATVLMCVQMLQLPFAGLCHTWSDLEVHSGLHECLALAAQHVVLHYVGPTDCELLLGWAPKTRKVKLVQWKEKHPSRKATQSVVAGFNSRHDGDTLGSHRWVLPDVALCVYICAEKAPYADIVAPYRLVQCKHSATTSRKQPIGTLKELSKVGLHTTSPAATDGSSDTSSDANVDTGSDTTQGDDDATFDSGDEEASTDASSSAVCLRFYDLLRTFWNEMRVDRPALDPVHVGHRFMYPTSLLDPTIFFSAASAASQQLPVALWNCTKGSFTWKRRTAWKAPKHRSSQAGAAQPPPLATHDGTFVEFLFVTNAASKVHFSLGDRRKAFTFTEPQHHLLALFRGDGAAPEGVPRLLSRIALPASLSAKQVVVSVQLRSRAPGTFCRRSLLEGDRGTKRPAAKESHEELSQPRPPQP